MNLSLITNLAMWLTHMKTYFLVAGIGYLFCCRRDYARAFMAMMAAVVSCAYLKCLVECPMLSSYAFASWTLPADQIVAAIAFWGWLSKESAIREYMAAALALLGLASYAVIDEKIYTSQEVMLAWLFALAILLVFNWVLENWPKGKEAMLGVSLAGLGAGSAICIPAALKYLWYSVGVLLGGSLGWNLCTSKDRKGCQFDWDTGSKALLALGGVFLIYGCCYMYKMPFVCKTLVCHAIIAWWVTCGHERLWAWKASSK